MRIVTARRISQIFFCLLFLWFCLVTTLGTRWWQLRGWPVNWFLQLDPLVGLATVLSTGVLYSGLLWCLLTIVLTIFLGRFFCGWLCPFGALQQVIGFWARKSRRLSAKVRLNQYHPWQSLKYHLLIFLLAAAAVETLAESTAFYGRHIWTLFAVVGLLGLVLMGTARYQSPLSPRTAVKSLIVVLLIWIIARWGFNGQRLLPASLQTGLLDPLPLIYRSLNLVLLPLGEILSGHALVGERFYTGAGLIGLIFIATLLMCMRVPRFYCRFICPLGALFGALAPLAVWRIRKGPTKCAQCHQCEADCEGGCTPSTRLRSAECVLCFNCRSACRHGRIQFGSAPSATRDIPVPDLNKRAFMASLAGGLCAVPILRIEAFTGSNWPSTLVRPPGALPEAQFLNRCIKCGQCMRVCPTNVIQPAGFDQGLEALWTPRLNFRIGTSGCQLNCVACGHVCPTAAIRPLHLDERRGQNEFQAQGALCIGTAFVDRGRCLPWAMDKPCIVCQENCPVSPKAIVTRPFFSRLTRPGTWTATRIDDTHIELAPTAPVPADWASGDYYCRIENRADSPFIRIARTGLNSLGLATPLPRQTPPERSVQVGIYVRLQRPHVDPRRCIGCGVCEHECPVPGLRAIRVTAEGETRHPHHRMLLPRSDSSMEG